MASQDSFVLIDDFFIDWGKKDPVVQFPFYVQEALYELTLNYLISQPKDVLSYCLDFFNEMKASKRFDIVVPAISEEFDGFELAAQRRQSVFAKAFDPKDLCESDNRDDVIYPKSNVDKIYLQMTLSSLLFFKNIEEADLDRIINAMFMKTVVKGEKIIQQGDDGDFFYVIQEGIFNALIDKNGIITDLCQYSNSGYFGELALLYNQPRAATVVAMTDGVIWALDRNTFQNIVLSSSFKRSLCYESMIENVPLLKSLSPMEKMKVADTLKFKEFFDEEVIIRQGDPATGMFFIESGVVQVWRQVKGKGDVLVNKLKAGGYFGELALLAKRPRAATVVAEGHVKLGFLDVDAFERLLGPCMNIMMRNLELYNMKLDKAFGSDYNLVDL